MLIVVGVYLNFKLKDFWRGLWWRWLRSGVEVEIVVEVIMVIVTDL